METEPSNFVRALQVINRLREENASMRTTLKQIHSLTDPYADGAPDASAHDKLALEISTITKPFA